MSLDTEITTNFYDEETGELIEIEDGYVVGRHKSVLTKQERLTINHKRAQRLVTQQASLHKEEPYVAPVMFEEQQPVSNSGPLVMPELTWEDDEPKPDYSDQGTPSQNQQEEPLVAPVMTWD
jgi:hypothetical protein